MFAGKPLLAEKAVELLFSLPDNLDDSEVSNNGSESDEDYAPELAPADQYASDDEPPTKCSQKKKEDVCEKKSLNDGDDSSNTRTATEAIS